MARLVIADASPLIGLAKIGGLVWLKQLFGEVWIPQQVLDEVLPGQGFPEESIIQAAFIDAWLRVPDSIPLTPALPDLDEGESACIRFALGQDRVLYRFQEPWWRICSIVANRISFIWINIRQ